MSDAAPAVVVGPGGRFVRFDDYRLIQPGSAGAMPIRQIGVKQDPVYINAASVVSVMADDKTEGCTLLHALGSPPIQVRLPLREVLFLLSGDASMASPAAAADIALLRDLRSADRGA